MKRGITLVETVIAVTVLVMALGGPFLLAARSLTSAGYAREEIAAARLAEEGLEIIHNMRDNNSAEYETGRLWDADLTSCANGCVIDVTKLQNAAEPESIWVTGGSYHAIISCGGACSGEQHRVYRHNASGFYRQLNLTEPPGGIPAGYSKTTMTRVIKITPVSSSNREYNVQSIVTFAVGNKIRTVTLNGTIMNWFPSMTKLI